MSTQKQLTSVFDPTCGIDFVPAAKMLKFLRGCIEETQKDVLGPHVGNRQRPKFLMDLKRESARATQSGRVAAWERRKVKLWEEPDQKLVTDDVRGGCCSFWAERQYAAARTPASNKISKA